MESVNSGFLSRAFDEFKCPAPDSLTAMLRAEIELVDEGISPTIFETESQSENHIAYSLASDTN